MMASLAQSHSAPTPAYESRKAQLTDYFDRTAADAWEALTSDAPVSRIRATVRAGRDRMRECLLARLPQDMTGLALLDAGCGTGALSLAAAQRGARVTAIDVSPRMVDIARQRAGEDGRDIRFLVGDMLDPALGRFDHVVAMDSLIHYPHADIARALAGLAVRAERSVLATVAPRTRMLAAMHTIGRIFPRGNRAPALEPVDTEILMRRLGPDALPAGFTPRLLERVESGFYISQPLELARA